MTCHETCHHGNPCTDHVDAPLIGTRTHVANAEDGQHRFWLSAATGAWHCIVLTVDDLPHMMPTDSEVGG